MSQLTARVREMGSVQVSGPARGVPSGVPAWGGAGQRHFARTNLKPRKSLENAARTHPMVPAYFAEDQLHIVDIVPTRRPRQGGAVLARQDGFPMFFFMLHHHFY